MQLSGVLTKMQTEISGTVQYYLVFSHGFLHLNQVLNQTIQITHTGFECLECHKSKKIFRQGFCYECFMKSASAGDWIMRPELSTAHLDIEDRDLEYEKKVQLQPHVVYLALSSEVKVGVTRKTQIPTRWIDQGAIAAIPVVEVPNRFLAGITEVALKNYFSDKTNWQKMLKNDFEMVNLESERNKLENKLPSEVQHLYEQQYFDVFLIDYPVLQYPTKIKSLNLTNQNQYSGKLIGIKGQYLIFEDGTVFNVRTFEGFVVNIKIY